MTQNPPLLIAIDGPAASGKGTLGRRMAEHFGYAYLDTGSLYRAVAAKLLLSGENAESTSDPGSKAAKIAVNIASELTLQELVDIEIDLTSEEVGRAASFVSAIPAVRDALLEFQRKVAKSPQGAVLDGRDIGTVVCPDANFKFYITASLEARAERRTKQLQSQDDSVIYDSVLQDLRDRDERDRLRAVAPMRPADDAISVDTTDMSMEEVLKSILSIISASTE